MMRVVLLLLLLAPVAASAQADRWTVEHVLQQESLSGIDISPDGSQVLWVKRTPDLEKDRYTSDIFVTDVNGSETAWRQLTRSGDNGNPAWSPDGKRFAFTSSRPTPSGDKNGRQLWIMDLNGGEPYPITSLKSGFQGYEWLDEGTILFTAREEETEYERALKKGHDDVLVVEDSTLFEPVRLFTLKVSTKAITRVTTNTLQIGSFAASPDGQWVAYSLNRSPITADAATQPHQFLLNLKTGATQEIFPGPYFDPSNFRWALDGSGFYATDEFASDPQFEGAGITKLYWFDLAAGNHEEVPLDWDWGLGYGYDVTAQGVHAQLAAGAYFHPRHYRKTDTGWTWTDVTDPRLKHTTSLSIGPDGETFVFDYSEADKLPTYLVGRYENGAVSETYPVAKINAYLDALPIPDAEVIEWAGWNGETVNGILYYPLDYDASRSYPLITAIHGGPAGTDLDAWRLSWTIYPGLWAQKGAFVFRPNYHGSGNHGLEFVESIKGHYYEKEVPDIVNGVQHLVDRGMVNPDSMAVMGWSNGAILAIALSIEHPEMFKAFAPGAGDVNWISDYGNCSFGVSFDNSYFKGPPWEHLDHYIEKSPIFKMDRVQAPTIIFFGEKDRAVPNEQGWQHYRALQQIGKVPVRFLEFPGMGHGLTKPSYQKRKMEEEIDWFDYYLWGNKTWSETLAERALPKTAPLANLDRWEAIARVDGAYGVRRNGPLLPEVVAVSDSLHVGRFEVTRAQFQAFRPSYPVPAGTENYPANGLTMEDARAYLTWLSAQTGGSYRLPSEAEMKQLRSMAGASENTLAHWAGYTPTPDEATVLYRRLEQRGIGPSALLMPVGTRPAGNIAVLHRPLVFDTDGNVAEWATTDAGPRAMNNAAVTVRDARTADGPTVPLAFTGLRVVRIR